MKRTLRRAPSPCLLLLLLASSGCGAPADASRAGTPLRLADGGRSHALGWHTEYHVDPSGRLGYPAVAGPGVRFVPSDGEQINMPVSGRRVVWVRFTVDDRAIDVSWLLDLGGRRPQYVDLYFEDDAGRTQHRRNGDLVSRDLAEHDGRNLYLALPTSRTGPRTYYLRYDAQIININLHVVGARQFVRTQYRDNLVLGVLLGIMLGLVLYNLFLAFALWDVAYVYYAFMMWGTIAYQLGSTGIWMTYIVRPGEGVSYMGGSSVALAAIPSLLFMGRVLALAETHPVLDRAAWILIGVLALDLVLGLSGAYSLSVPLAVLGALGWIVFTTWACIARSAQGYRPAYYISGAWLVLLVSTTLTAGAALDWFDRGYWTNDFGPLAGAIEALLFSLGLADRVRRLREQRQEALHASTEAQAQALRLELQSAEELRAARQLFTLRLIDRQERDRARIARDMHDGLGHLLLLAKKRVAKLAGDNDGPRAEHADAVTHAEHAEVVTRAEHADAVTRAEHAAAVKSELQACIDESRRIAHELHPQALQRLGLRRAIEAAAEALASVGDVAVETHVAADAEERLGSQAIHAYRIVQEALANAVRHGGAAYIEVDLDVSGDQLLLSIADNGAGFRVPASLEVGHTTSLGLSGMAERARMLGGNLRVTSTAGEGTDVSVSIPLSALAEANATGSVASSGF